MRSGPTDLVYYDELEIRGRVAKLKLWALNILKPGDGHGRRDEGAGEGSSSVAVA